MDNIPLENKISSLKEKGNEAFAKKEYQNAINYYTNAIEMLTQSDKLLSDYSQDKDLEKLKILISNNENLLSCFNNRSQCFLNLERFQEAYLDAEKGKN